ncbi:MAG TPA: hypothetical protein VGS19_37950 [Streptosporangiaceae bacterium]|nr:hypothetical protein [Streptosporangiaceae bacterium]
MSILWAYLQFRAIVFVFRVAVRVAAFLALVAVLVAAAPLTLVTGVAFLGAWLRGWPPARLYRAAAWSLPMTGVYLAGRALQVRTWQALALAPGHDYVTAWHAASLGRLLPAFLLAAPVAVPVGLALAGVLWAWRTYAIQTGLAGKTATAPVVFDARQWDRATRAARGRIAAPGTFPLADSHGRVVMGATIRAIGHRWRPVLTVPYTAMGVHQVVLGSSGCGKTNLMMRTWAGWYAAALAAARTRGAPRPLLVVLDCKGGPDSRAKATRTARLLFSVGAVRVAVWPDQTSVSLWALPPRDLAVSLFQMVSTGAEGPAAYYADVMQAVLMLAITAPPAPPVNGADFLQRLDAAWLTNAYASDPQRLGAVASARTHLGDIALRYRTLLERLGPALDGPGGLAGADAWYFILEGTSQATVAEAQAMAITELLAHAVTDRDGEPRTVLLACDDYSAVSGKVPLWQLYERGRSLGIGVQVSAQSWEGLGADEDERNRIAATADGGIWLMRTPWPDPVCKLAGTRRVVETATKVIGGMFGDEGSARVQHAWTVDPDIARSLDVGQAAYIHRGGATWVQIARPRPSPLPLPPSPKAPTVIVAPPASEHAPPPGPDGETAGPALDDVFGEAR